MGLVILPNASLEQVQQNVKKEIDALTAAQPSKKTSSVRVTTDYTVKLTDAIVLVNSVAAANITLPPVASCKGLSFTIKNVANASAVYLRGNYSATSPELIDGAVRLTLAPGVSAAAYSDGAAWWVL